MTIIERAREMLAQNGYRTSLDEDSAQQVLFENSSIFGFVAVYTTVDALLADWGPRQEEFLRRHARALQLHPDKAWNAYAVFLAERADDSEVSNRLGVIEEDFQATRKIARSGIASVVDLRRAMSPLLTVSHAQVLEGVDVEGRLASLLPATALSALLEDRPPQFIADLIEEM